MISDFKFALRQLAKTPGFALIAILTLALGIGANSAIFSVIDAVLLRPLPFPKPNQLIAAWSKADGAKETDSFPDYADLRDQSQTIDALTAFTAASSVLGNGDESRELRGLAITSDVFQVLGVQPFLGRAFTRAEDTADSHLIVLSYDLWRSAFHSDRGIIGREILLSLRPYTVLGVMPRGFRYPVGERMDYMMPLHPLVPNEIGNRGGHFLRMVGRLKPAANARQASAELGAIASRLEKQFRDTNTGRTAYAIPLRDDLVGQVRPALITVLAAVFLVLLIACANVANLLLARAIARRREIAIRTALGASRTRIVRQLLAEGFILACAGGGAGLLLAWWGIDLLRLFGPHDVPRLDEIRINIGVVIFSFAAVIFSTLLFATAPALQVSRPNVSEALQEGSRGAIGPESYRLRALLVISQVALSVLLLAGAGLLIKSFKNLRTTDPGFDASRMLTADLSLPRLRYSDPQKQKQFFEQLLPKLAVIPGMENVGGAMPLAFSGNDRDSSFWIDGRPDPGLGNHPDASHLIVDGDYFQAMRIPILRGRTFDKRDNASGMPVAMINATFARKFFPNEDPIGKVLRIDTAEGKPDVRQIVGVVGSTRHESLAIAPLPEMYAPAAQGPTRRLNLVLRASSANPAGMQNAVRIAIHEIDPEVYVPRLEPLSNLIDHTLAQPRFNTALLGCFAAVAMTLAAIGIYGVIAYNVVQRTREIGIRMALGAQRPDMLRMILRQSFSVVSIGLISGLAAALALTRLMSSLLYGVSAHDFSIYVFVLSALSGAALIASYFPARRAMNVDPMVALRYE
jgi:putative ABC transport system permease protein